MPNYRIYAFSHDGHIAAPATIVDCVDDQEAIVKAGQALNGKDVELWEGRRLVARFPRSER
jgi:hypothetical protein